MSRSIPFSVLYASLLALSGCADRYAIKEYVPPRKSEAADVEYVVTHGNRHSDSVRISLLARPSCSDKLSVVRVAALRPGGLIGSDSSYRQSGRLPANETLNIEVSKVTGFPVFDTRNPDFLVAQCSALQSYKLDAGARYLLRIGSPEKTRYAGLACGFKIAEIDDAGKDIRTLAPLRPALPACTK